jgi:hypothetical protein
MGCKQKAKSNWHRSLRAGEAEAPRAAAVMYERSRVIREALQTARRSENQLS